MPLAVAEKNALADNYATRATHGACYTTAPGTAAGTEPSGGSPAYARKALTWGASSNGVKSATPAVFDIPSGASIAGAGVHDALTGGTYRDGFTFGSPQAFASQGQLTVTYTYTQT